MDQWGQRFRPCGLYPHRILRTDRIPSHSLYPVPPSSRGRISPTSGIGSRASPGSSFPLRFLRCLGRTQCGKHRCSARSLPPDQLHSRSFSQSNSKWDCCRPYARMSVVQSLLRQSVFCVHRPVNFQIVPGLHLLSILAPSIFKCVA